MIARRKIQEHEARSTTVHSVTLTSICTPDSARLRQTRSVSITAPVVRMTDDLGGPQRRPSHPLGIAPALMANRHTKLSPVDLEELPGIPGHIELILARGELVLGLVPLDLAPGV